MKRFHIFGHNHGMEYPQLKDDITSFFFSLGRIVFSGEYRQTLFNYLKSKTKYSKILYF